MACLPAGYLNTNSKVMLANICGFYNDATDRKAVGLIGRGLWVGIITVQYQVPGGGSGVRACGPEVAVRTLIVNLTVTPDHAA